MHICARLKVQGYLRPTLTIIRPSQEQHQRLVFAVECASLFVIKGIAQPSMKGIQDDGLINILFDEELVASTG